MHRDLQPVVSMKILITFRRRIAAGVVAATLILGARGAPACTWAIGYFYQVTTLRGTVVGTDLPLLHSIRWIRQRFVRQNVKLALYEYRWPRVKSKMVPLKSVVTDSQGRFDFGTLRPGHYTLRIDQENWPETDFFDVELKGLANPRESETIDISPVSPDCSGGHEFIVKTK